MVDGVVRKVGLDGELIEEPALVPLQPLHEIRSMRDQALQEQEERAIGLAKHAEDSMARERGRQQKNAEARERAAEFEKEQRRLAAGDVISK